MNTLLKENIYESIKFGTITEYLTGSRFKKDISRYSHLLTCYFRNILNHENQWNIYSSY